MGLESDAGWSGKETSRSRFVRTRVCWGRRSSSLFWPKVRFGSASRTWVARGKKNLAAAASQSHQEDRVHLPKVGKAMDEKQGRPRSDVPSKKHELESEMSAGPYVGDASWEERTWKEIVRLREDMFWARVGGLRV